jgi:hypothetical protein
MSKKIVEEIKTTAHSHVAYTTELEPGTFAPIEFSVVDSDKTHVIDRIHFHSGPIHNGVNGVMNEDLLHMVKVRLEYFQESQFRCDENGEALEHVKAAIEVLSKRSQERKSRGVEGTHAI